MHAASPNTMAARAHCQRMLCASMPRWPAVEAEAAVCSVGGEVPLQLPSALRGSVAIDGDVVAVAFAPACTEAEYAHCKVRFANGTQTAAHACCRSESELCTEPWLSGPFLR